MTPQTQRITIAEALGAKWRSVSCASHASLSFNTMCEEANWEWSQRDWRRLFDDTVPNYSGDLDEVNSAVETLCVTRARRDLYMLKLYDLVKPRGENLDRHWAIHTASAAERAEALASVICSWWGKGGRRAK